MDLTITVCDVDLEQGRDTKRYTLRQGVREVTVDLCEEHAEPLEALFDDEDRARPEAALPKGPEERPSPVPREQPTKQPKKPAVRRRRGPRVVSLEEIEASKKS